MLFAFAVGSLRSCERFLERVTDELVGSARVAKMRAKAEAWVLVKADGVAEAES